MTRRSEIIKRLSDMSRHGWRDSLPAEYQALERELSAINAKRRRASAKLEPLERNPFYDHVQWRRGQ